MLGGERTCVIHESEQACKEQVTLVNKAVALPRELSADKVIRCFFE
jgi:hypothetical protein